MALHLVSLLFSLAILLICFGCSQCCNSFHGSSSSNNHISSNKHRHDEAATPPPQPCDARQQMHQNHQQQEQQERVMLSSFPGNRSTVAAPNILQADTMITFRLSLVASQPTNPASLASCIARSTLAQSMAWFNNTHPYDTVVNISTPTIVYLGDGTTTTRRRQQLRRRQLATTSPPKYCNYLCILHQIAICRLCGNHRRELAPTNSRAKPTVRSPTMPPTRAPVLLVYNNTNATVPTNNNVTTAPTTTTTTTTEVTIVEQVMKALLPVACVGVNGISSAVLTVTEVTI